MFQAESEAAQEVRGPTPQRRPVRSSPAPKVHVRTVCARHRISDPRAGLPPTAAMLCLDRALPGLGWSSIFDVDFCYFTTASCASSASPRSVARGEHNDRREGEDGPGSRLAAGAGDGGNVWVAQVSAPGPEAPAGRGAGEGGN